MQYFSIQRICLLNALGKSLFEMGYFGFSAKRNTFASEKSHAYLAYLIIWPDGQVWDR